MDLDHVHLDEKAFKAVHHTRTRSPPSRFSIRS
jgi:hypothetical protein